MNITEDYVSYGVAKLLKEKGFDEPCQKCYYISTKSIEDVHNGRNTTLLSFFISCPTLQMAMKWLREVHNIFIIVYLFDREKPFTENSLYTCDIATNKTSSQQGHLRGVWKTYEEAVKAALKYVLTNLI